MVTMRQVINCICIVIMVRGIMEALCGKEIRQGRKNQINKSIIAKINKSTAKLNNITHLVQNYLILVQ